MILDKKKIAMGYTMTSVILKPLESITYLESPTHTSVIIEVTVEIERW